MRLLAAMGFAGVGFHAYGVSRNMGGWRNWSQNVLNGPPLPAPPSFAGLALAGLAALGLMKDHPDADLGKTLRQDRYPGYDVLAKRTGPSWNEQTRRVITRRLVDRSGEPRFFTAEEFQTVERDRARIVPQPAASPADPGGVAGGREIASRCIGRLSAGGNAPRRRGVAAWPHGARCGS